MLIIYTDNIETKMTTNRNLITTYSTWYDYKLSHIIYRIKCLWLSDKKLKRFIGVNLKNIYCNYWIIYFRPVVRSLFVHTRYEHIPFILIYYYLYYLLWLYCCYLASFGTNVLNKVKFVCLSNYFQFPISPMINYVGCKFKNTINQVKFMFIMR